MRDEGVFSAAGKRLVLFGTVLVLGGLLAYFLIAEDISIDLDQLTDTSTTSTTSVEFDSSDLDTLDVDTPDLDTPYLRCVDRAETVDEILDCGDV